MTQENTIAYGSAMGRRILLMTILASGMGFLDSTVVNVALPRIEEELGGGFATIQWVLDSYLLTLGSLVLVGGALGDVLGRKRVFIWGVVGFAFTSVLCGLAPTATTLIAARALQGIAAALMIPGSLSLLSSLFRAQDRGKAIGAWSGLAGLVTALGPFVGGLLVDSGSGGWRWIFILNVPLAGVVLLLARRVPTPDRVPSTGAPHQSLAQQVDFTGAGLTVLGLALIVTPLIEANRIPTWLVALSITAGLLVLYLFWVLERRREFTRGPPPMLPPSMWRIRSFSMANLITFFVYGGLGSVLLLFTIGFQIGLGWSALAAGAAGIPITIVLALLSAKIGGLLPKYGSRNLLTLGSALIAAGAAWLALLPDDASYWIDVLPPLLVFAVGLAFMVAPITTTALGDIPVESSGIGSGVNNAVARIASLITIALVPLAAGLSGLNAEAGAAVLPGYRRAMFICAGLMALGAVLAWFGFSKDTGRVATPDAVG